VEKCIYCNHPDDLTDSHIIPECLGANLKIQDAVCHDCNSSLGRTIEAKICNASRLVERGVDLITVKDLLGHSTVKMTERYTHSSRQSKKNAVELLAQKCPEKEASRETLSPIRHAKNQN